MQYCIAVLTNSYPDDKIMPYCKVVTMTHRFVGVKAGSCSNQSQCTFSTLKFSTHRIQIIARSKTRLYGIMAITKYDLNKRKEVLNSLVVHVRVKRVFS